MALFRDARDREFRVDYGSNLIRETTFIRVGVELTQRTFTDGVEPVPADATMRAESQEPLTSEGVRKRQFSLQKMRY